MPSKPLRYIDPKGKNKEQLIRSQTPIHSKSATQSWYDNYDRIFKKKSWWCKIINY